MRSQRGETARDLLILLAVFCFVSLIMSISRGREAREREAFLEVCLKRDVRQVCLTEWQNRRQK